MLAPPNRISSKTIAAPHRGGLDRLGHLIRGTLILVACCGAGLLVGCTIPSDCGDLDYPTYGGAWQRTRRDSGRVGSLFDPAGARSATLADRDDAADPEDARSPAESIHSAPLPADRDRRSVDPNDTAEPSPSDRPDRDRLRSLDLEEIDVQSGTPAPPDLN